MPDSCFDGNCRTKADCASVLDYSSGVSGTYCRTSKDTCRTDKDCATTSDYGVCVYEREVFRWACRIIPPQLPG